MTGTRTTNMSDLENPERTLRETFDLLPSMSDNDIITLQREEGYSDITLKEIVTTLVESDFEAYKIFFKPFNNNSHLNDIHLYDESYVRIVIRDSLIDAIRDNVGLLPVNDKGKFLTRLEKWLKSAHQIKITGSTKNDLGNYIQNNSPAPIAYHFDFTDEFDWEAGDFGDDGSCFWESNIKARSMIKHYRGRAIRFYDRKYGGDYSGIGRAWLLYDDEHDCIVQFNAYCESNKTEFSMLNDHGGSHKPGKVAGILAEYLGLNVKKVKFVNHGSWTGTLYINNGAGYAIGHNVEHLTEIDLELSSSVPDYYEPEEEEYSYYCDRCGDGLTEYDDCYSLNDYGAVICEDCRSRWYTMCESCNFATRDNEIVQVHTYRNSTYYSHSEYCMNLCDDCATNQYRYSECEECGRNWEEDHITMTDDGCAFCRDCAEEHTFTCESCDNTYSDNVTSYEVEEQTWCNDCVDNNAYICESCNRIRIASNYITDFEGRDYCADCADRITRPEADITL